MCNEINKNANELKKNADELKRNTDELKKNTDELKKNTEEVKKNTIEVKSNTAEIKSNNCNIKKTFFYIIFAFITMLYPFVLYNIFCSSRLVNVKVLALLILSFHGTLFLIMWFYLRINGISKPENITLTSVSIPEYIVPSVRSDDTTVPFVGYRYSAIMIPFTL